MGRKKWTPSVSRKAAATSLGDGGFKRREADASDETPSPADLACDRARKVCTRILGELDAWLAGGTHHTEEDQDGTE